MTVVTISSALLGDHALRRVNCTSACPSLAIEQTRLLHQPFGSALQPVKHSDAFAHSQDPRLTPRPHIFASYLEETCRLLAADRGLSDTMSTRFPRAAATEAAKTRLFEFIAQLFHRAPAELAAPRRPHP